MQRFSRVCLGDRVSNAEMLRQDHLNSGNRLRSARKAHLLQVQAIHHRGGLVAPEKPTPCQTAALLGMQVT